MKPWFHSWYRGRVETLDAKYNLIFTSLPTTPPLLPDDIRMVILLQNIRLPHKLIHIVQIIRSTGLHSHHLPVQVSLEDVPKSSLNQLLPDGNVPMVERPLIMLEYWPEYLDRGIFGDGRAVVQERTNGGEGFGLKAKHFLAIFL